MMINPLGSGNNNGNGSMHGLHFPIRDRQLTFRDYVRVLYKGRYIILISFLTVLCSTLLYTFTTEPIYEAAAKIMVEQKGGMGESLFDFTSIMQNETMINNQVEILKSRTLAEIVINNLERSEYSNQLRILGNEPPGNGHVSSSFWRKIFGGNGRKPADSEQVRNDGFSESLRKSISVAPIRNTDMIEIKVKALSPFEAAYLTNEVAEAYKTMNQAQSQAEVRQVKNFLEEQLEKLRSELAHSEESLKNYKERAKVVALDKETEELVRKVAEFETMYNEAVTEWEANKQRLAYVNQKLIERNVNIDMETISSQPYLSELKKQMAEKEAELAKYRAQLVDLGLEEETNSNVLQLRAQVQALKDKFRLEAGKAAAADFVDPAQLSGTLFASKIEAETEIQSLRPKVDALKAIVDRYNRELESLPEKSLTLARLLRSAQVDEKIYIMLQEKYQESRITEVGQLGNVRIIDSAKPPKYPIKPKKKLNALLGLLVGLGLGIGIAFVLEYMDSSVRTMEDVEKLSLSIMATIPFIKPEQVNSMFPWMRNGGSDPEVKAINERLVVHLKPKSPISEAYRTLRTNLLFTTPDQPKKVLMVTSSGPKEGKSTTVANLAITFAQMGNRTLLIDADLRRPILHKLFGLDRKTGLTNILVGRSTLEEAVKVMDDLPHLELLSCGILPPNPAELLAAQKMRELLEYARTQYAVVLIDTPPTIAVTDASILASLVDGVLLVIRSGVTEKEAVARAFDQLKKVNAPIMGAVLNSIKAADVYGSYYYYYYHQYYYGADMDKKKPKRVSAPGRVTSRENSRTEL